MFYLEDVRGADALQAFIRLAAWMRYAFLRGAITTPYVEDVCSTCGEDVSECARNALKCDQYGWYRGEWQDRSHYICADDTEAWCEDGDHCRDCCCCIFCDSCGSECSDEGTCGDCENCSSCCCCLRCSYCGEVSESLCENRDRCTYCCADVCTSCQEDDEEDESSDLMVGEHGSRTPLSEFVERVGLEIEFQYGDSTSTEVLAELRNAGLEVLDRRGTHSGSCRSQWTLKRDGSVSYGGELCSPILDYNSSADMGQIQKALNVLRNLGAKVDYQCGLHIHVEARNADCSYFDSEQLRKIVRLAYRNEDALFALATRPGEQAHRGFSYCMPLQQSATRDGANLYGYARPGCNLSSFETRGTIEFRYFDSHFSMDHLRSQMAVCVAIVRLARRKALISRNAFPVGYVSNGGDRYEVVNALKSVVTRGGISAFDSALICERLLLASFQRSDGPARTEPAQYW